MKRSTLMGCFVGLLALTMQSQIAQPSISTTQQGTTKIENQNKSGTSIEDLLVRYNNVGNQSGSISAHFTMEEQRMLRSYFSNKLPAKSNQIVEGVSGKSSVVPTSAANAPLGKGGVAKKAQYTPLFVDINSSSSLNVQLPYAYRHGATVAIAETTGVATSQSSVNFEGNVPFTGTYYFRAPNAIVYDNGPYFNVAGPPDISFLEDTSLSMGTFGSGAQFTAGNSIADDVVLTADYDINSIDVFAYQTGSTAPSITAVYLQVWDGDPSGGGASVIWGDLTTNILDVATATNAFRQLESVPGATNREIQRATVNTTGLSLTAGTYWIEYTFAGSGASGPWAPPIAILGQSTTGNAIQYQGALAAWGPLVDVGPQGLPFVMYGDPVGGGSVCSQADVSNAFENGLGDTNNTLEIGDEIIVAADTNFEVDQLTINMINNGGFNSIDVAFYEDAGGMPGAMIGSVMTIVPTSSTAIGVAFGRDVLSIVLDIAPGVMLNGTAGSETVYWIGVETPNPVDPASDAYWETTSIPNAGTDYRVQSRVGIGAWTPTLPADGMWNTVYNVSGTCESIAGPGPLTTVYGINNGNQDLIGFGVATPGTTEVFGTSPITVNFENAGAIDPANPTTGYALDNAGQFYSFDVTSGFYTLLGNIPGDWIGMEFDRVSGTLYAIAGADLYTIDPVAVTATLVGATGINPGDLPIALAIDGAGVGYTYEIVTDNLYSIDLATAAATLIGSIGFDANFGQGMCYDPTTDMVYMSAFNGTAFASEWRSVNTTTGATTLIGEIITPAATTQVAWSSIGETLPPPACPKPTDLVVSNITETTADLSWSAEPNASNGYVWYVFLEGANPAVDPEVSTGTTVAGTTTATAGGLTNGTAYDFYVVADCDVDGFSSYAGPVTFETLITPPACGGKFYDTGGAAGNYENSANVTTTITPTNPGELVTVTFTSFQVETGWDALYVYDGPNASSPIISSGNPATNGGFPAGGYYGSTNPGPFTSSHATGALTFVFLSDASVPQAGWEADVTCALSPPPNDLIVNSIDVDEIGFPYTDPAVHMPAATTEGGNPQNCDITGANGVWYNFVSVGDGQANASIVTPGGASSVTFYTAPDENAIETDLVLVPQNTNQCAPGTSASIYTLAGQAYYVFVLNSGAITDIMIDGTNLGLTDNTLTGFSFYPNPTNGILNLKSVDNIEHVSLYNLLGQIVVNNRVEATTSQIDISGLSTGTYLMKVTVNGQTGTYKVLKD